MRNQQGRRLGGDTIDARYRIAYKLKEAGIHNASMGNDRGLHLQKGNRNRRVGWEEVMDYHIQRVKKLLEISEPFAVLNDHRHSGVGCREKDQLQLRMERIVVKVGKRCEQSGVQEGDHH